MKALLSFIVFYFYSLIKLPKREIFMNNSLEVLDHVRLNFSPSGLVFFIVLMHNALALSTGYFFGKLNKLNMTDQRTIAIETGIQNSGLALALMFNPKIFPPEMELGGMAIIAAWWGIWHIISGLSIAWFWSRKPAIA